MAVDVADIRLCINIPAASDLADNVIQKAIDRATAIITHQARPDASAAMVEEAIRAKAAYYAYKAYADRITHIAPGMFDSATGRWKPAFNPVVRETADKLKTLENEAGAAMKLVSHRIGALV